MSNAKQKKIAPVKADVFTIKREIDTKMSKGIDKASFPGLLELEYAAEECSPNKSWKEDTWRDGGSSWQDSETETQLWKDDIWRDGAQKWRDTWSLAKSIIEEDFNHFPKEEVIAKINETIRNIS